MDVNYKTVRRDAVSFALRRTPMSPTTPVIRRTNEPGSGTIGPVGVPSTLKAALKVGSLTQVWPPSSEYNDVPVVADCSQLMVLVEFVSTAIQ